MRRWFQLQRLWWWQTRAFHPNFHGIISTWNLGPMSEENVKLGQAFFKIFVAIIYLCFEFQGNPLLQVLRSWVRIIMQTHNNNNIQKKRFFLFPSGFYFRPILCDSPQWQSSPNRKPRGTLSRRKQVHMQPTLCQLLLLLLRVEHVRRWIVDRPGWPADRELWGCG